MGEVFVSSVSQPYAVDVFQGHTSFPENTWVQSAHVFMDPRFLHAVETQFQGTDRVRHMMLRERSSGKIVGWASTCLYRADVSALAGQYIHAAMAGIRMLLPNAGKFEILFTGLP